MRISKMVRLRDPKRSPAIVTETNKTLVNVAPILIGGVCMEEETTIPRALVESTGLMFRWETTTTNQISHELGEWLEKASRLAAEALIKGGDWT